MSFLFPAFLAGAVAVTVPVLLHLLRKEEAPEVEFPAVQFIQRHSVERSKRHRLRDLILLALRVGALLLLACSFARPYLVDAAAGALSEAVIIAVDVSFSMGGELRAVESRRLALEALDRAPVDAGVAVMAFDDSARIVAPLSRDRAAARQTIPTLEPGYGATNYRAMLAAAADEMAGRPGRVVVVSDLQRRGWLDGTGTLPASATLELAPVSPASENLAIVAATREARAIRAVVAHHGKTRRTIQVVLSVGDRVIGTRKLELDSDRPRDVDFTESLPDHGVARLSLEDPGGLPGDDARFVALDPIPPVRAAIVSGDTARGRSAFYVERALGVPAQPRPVTARVLPGVEIQTLSDEQLAQQEVLLVLGTRSVDRRTRDRLDAWVSRGGGVLVTAGPLTDPTTFASWLGDGADVRPVAEEASDTSLAPIDVRHPVFRAFGTLTGSLGQVRFQRSVIVEAGSQARVLARFTNGHPALLERNLGEGRVLLFASDLGGEWNDFPRKPSFLPFLHEVVQHLSGGRTSARDLTIADAPAGAARRPGAATLPTGEGVVLNADARESDLSIESEADFREHVDEGPAPGQRDLVREAKRREDEQGLWRYGLIVAAVVLVGEALLGRVWA